MTGFVDELLEKTLPLYIQWGTSVVNGKITDRLLVISNYRVFMIRRTSMGKKKIVADKHLFELRSIITPDPDKVTFSLYIKILSALMLF
jgi:hypothetical protein